MIRRVKRIVEGEHKIDGAGVELVRVIGKPTVKDFDPFLMLDAFDHDNPEKYLKGFPWHPHRGIETVTYLIEGEIQHGDSLGNRGVIYSGDCQWMTAGSGIIHQEMPQAAPKMLGVQLWVNLPAKDKMVRPKYRDFTKGDIPVVKDKDATVYIVAGEFAGKKGPMEEINVQPTFLDVRVGTRGDFTLNTEPDDNLFIYILSGSVILEAEENRVLTSKQAILFGEGDLLKLKAGSKGLQFLLFSGKPLNEPVAWGGPIVMNTAEELALAFKEIDNGTFIKKHHEDGTFSSSDVHKTYYQ